MKKSFYVKFIVDDGIPENRYDSFLETSLFILDAFKNDYPLITNLSIVDDNGIKIYGYGGLNDLIDYNCMIVDLHNNHEDIFF